MHFTLYFICFCFFYYVAAIEPFAFDINVLSIWTMFFFLFILCKSIISHYISISSFHKQFFNYFFFYFMLLFCSSYHLIFLIFLLHLLFIYFFIYFFAMLPFLFIFYFYFFSIILFLFLIYIFLLLPLELFFYYLRLYTKHNTGEHINFFLIHENFYTPISDYQFSLFFFIYFSYSLFVCCLIFFF